MMGLICSESTEATGSIETRRVAFISYYIVVKGAQQHALL